MISMFRSGASYGGMAYAEGTLDDEEKLEEAAATAYRAILIKAKARAKPKEDAVTKAWNAAGQPKEGIVVAGIRHKPLDFDGNDDDEADSAKAGGK